MGCQSIKVGDRRKRKKVIRLVAINIGSDFKLLDGLEQHEIELVQRLVSIYSLFIYHKNLGSNFDLNRFSAVDIERLHILENKVNEIKAARNKRRR